MNTSIIVFNSLWFIRLSGNIGKKLLDAAKRRESWLFRKFFSVHKAETISRKIKKKVLSIFREELTGLS